MDIIYHFKEGLHNIELWRKMFKSNPKTMGDMMMVINKHADMEDTERAHRQHKTQNDSSECLLISIICLFWPPTITINEGT